MMRSFANFKVRILLILLEQAINKHLKMITFNPFTPNAPFLYSLETSENLTVFWCF